MKTLFISLALVVLIQRLVEVRIARRNVKKMMAEGGREYGAGHYSTIISLHLAWYLAWIIESLHNGLHLSPDWPLWSALLLSAEVLRYWAMASLGSQWCMRIIVTPATRWIRNGPYRVCAHPNYLAVTIELFTIPMLFEAWRTATIATASYMALLFAFRIPAERKAFHDFQASH